MAKDTGAEPAGTGSEAKGPNARRKKLLLIGIAVAVLVGVGIGLGIVFSDRAASPESEPASSGQAAAIYVSLGDKFLVTLNHQGRQHYCKAVISVMTRDEEVVKQLGVHAPLIRARLISLIGEQDFAALRTDEGRIALREQMLATIQGILQQEMGRPGVEQVYFTEFVLQ